MAQGSDAQKRREEIGKGIAGRKLSDIKYTKERLRNSLAAGYTKLTNIQKAESLRLGASKRQSFKRARGKHTRIDAQRSASRFFLAAFYYRPDF